MRQRRQTKTSYQNDLFAEQLEARILYSGSPAPVVAHEVFFETLDAITSHSFSTIDEFSQPDLQPQMVAESDSPEVILLSFDNLSETEISELLALKNEPSANETSNLSADGEIAVATSLLPTVLISSPAAA